MMHRWQIVSEIYFIYHSSSSTAFDGCW